MAQVLASSHCHELELDGKLEVAELGWSWYTDSVDAACIHALVQRTSLNQIRLGFPFHADMEHGRLEQQLQKKQAIENNMKTSSLLSGEYYVRA